ncbi:MAG: DEAD/DEAH box helicase family protein [Chloroflexota bacterium]|nr:DEAD/DEAH box helicase family protein [Chloroflexota bacterium]
MARSDLEKFQRRLALVDYFRHVFGVEDVNDPDAVRRFYDTLEEQREEGYNAEGRSYVSNVLEGRVRGIEAADLLRYDANVKRHTEALNRRRTEPITLKYFQILAALMTEHYLHRVTHDPDAFLDDLNAFVEEQNEMRGGYIDLPSFTADDLNKLAFWMATGSGKTLLMHVNYYQYLDYYPNAAENILLVTPNAGLSQQHMAEMEMSGIPCRRFNADTGDLFSDDPRTVKVIEITKLVEEKTGGGKSVEVSHLEGPNLVFVDEGHKGASSEAEAWMNRRKALAENGFTFEYSATFGQGVGGAGSAIEKEYGKAIIFDYSYPRFYEDGYGKDYRILNLEHDLDPNLVHRYLLANLLTFYEQVRCYENNRSIFYAEYNVEPPLLTFVGHTVTAGKTWSSLGKNDMRSLSDVQALVIFLHRVLRNEDDWVPQAIDAILSGDSGLLREDGSDLFADAFSILRESRMDGAAIYRDMLERVFHVRQPTDLHLVNLQSIEGEIGLRAGPADRFFGLINIGDAANFLKLAQDQTPEIVTDEEQFSGSLFQAINQQGSPINILLGAKKFIEGWDSWRVSTMGLMNIGRGEGPQIIQLFGRGVRLLGRDRSLKRSTVLKGHHPKNLPKVETLNIFGVRASYMAQFRDYLAEEGIDTEERETVIIDTRINDDFKGEGLLVVRPRVDTSFQEVERLPLKLVDACKPTIDLTVHADVLVSDGLIREGPTIHETTEAQTLHSEHLDFLDWNKLYSETYRFCATHGYENLALDQRILRQILESEHYELYCDRDLITLNTFADVEQLQRIALMILRKYVDNFYTRAHRRWEQSQLAYQILDEDDENLVSMYEARVKRSAARFLQTLREMCDDPILYEREDNKLPRVHFDRHLYLPLLVEDPGDEPTVKYSPPGLNEGERNFVRALRDYFATDKGQDLLKLYDRDLFLLRNQSRGRGVGFLVNEERFFPDFILWLKSPERQDIVFIDPHGLVIGSNLDVNPKVQFYETIKEYEERLNAQAGRDDISLHSYIISQSSFEDLRKQTGIASKARFGDLHIYFKQDDYMDSLMRSVLTGRAV